MKYNIIYLDPPWTYKDKAHAGERGVEYKYPTMTLKDIQSLPIEKLADKNCFLFCWATMPLLDTIFETIKCWGFKYKTNGFVWIKTNKKKKDSIFWGGGSYTRANNELCLLAVKGKPKVVSHSVHSVIMSPIRKHSEKPPEARDRIVELCGDIPRIELFARHKILGWDCLGNDVDGRDIRESILDQINLEK